MIKRLFLLMVLVIGVGGLAVYFLVPWNDILQSRITAFLHSQGMQNVEFKIDKVGIHQATLNNVVIGADKAFQLKSITVEYDPRQILKGRLQDLTLTGLDINVLQTDEGWKIAGFEDFASTAKTQDKASPDLTSLVDMLPFSSVSIENSQLHITGKSVQTILPFNLHITKSSTKSIDATINASNVAAGKSNVSLGVLKMQAAPDDKGNWIGQWALESLSAGDLIPVLSGGGTLEIGKSDIAGTGLMTDATKTYNAAFHAKYVLDDPSQGLLVVDQVNIPFQNGSITASKVNVPINGIKPVTINARVQQVSIDELLQKLTGKKVTATGTVSGTVPVIVKRDGSFTLGQGNLKADSEGQIQMPGDVIPGDNDKVALVRQIMQDLHYKVLSANIETNGGQGMTVHLSLEGNNPGVLDGRTVKLNVNLTGDLLDFIQQNAMLITNPEKLLEQGKE